MRNNIFTIALKLHTLGFSVLPSGGGDSGKAPIVNWTEYQQRQPDDTELEAWQQKLKPNLWGIVTGAISGVVVVDADNAETRAAIEANELKPHVITPRGGAHYYFKHPGHHVKTIAGLLPKIDVRGDGGFVNLVGRRPDGEYKIVNLPTPDTLYPWDKLPVEIHKAINNKKPRALASRILQEALNRAQPGNRNDIGLWLACQLRDDGISQAEAEAVMLRYAARVGTIGAESYTEREAIATLEQAFTRPAREPWYTERPDLDKYRYTLTDSGNAERLADLFGGIVHYVREKKQFVVYNGKIWEPDISEAKVMAFSKLVARSIYKEAADEPDDEHRQAKVRHAKASESRQRRKAMIDCFIAEPGVEISVKQLDTNHFLLNCLNGTIDLKTGRLRPHDQADFITQIVPVEYKPGARSDFWDTFLQQIFDNKQELIDYIQCAVGYSATGSQRESAIFFNHGAGWNGKSTFLGAIQDTLGSDYATEIEPQVFMIQKFGKSTGPDESAAMLYKKRFVKSTEVQEGQRLSVSHIKRMSGGEDLHHNRKWEHAFNYQPTHKLWLSGNHEPIITDTTNSIWLRLKKIPFTVTFTSEKRNPNLRDELLKGHQEAILAWIVRGCVTWQKTGLVEPEIVTIATNQYREGQDILAEFLNRCCKFEVSVKETVADVYTTYKQWCEDNSNYCIGKNDFNTKLEEKGLRKMPGTGNKTTWHGIRLLTEEEKTEIEKQELTNYLQIVNSVNDITSKNKQISSYSKLLENPLTDLTKLTNQELPPKDAGGVFFFEDTVDIKAFNCPPCSVCGSKEFWQRVTGEQVCSRCHPEPGGLK